MTMSIGSISPNLCQWMEEHGREQNEHKQQSLSLTTKSVLSNSSKASVIQGLRFREPKNKLSRSVFIVLIAFPSITPVGSPEINTKVISRAREQAFIRSANNFEEMRLACRTPTNGF